MEFWTTIWDAIWWFITVFIFIAYLFALFSIITDLFRDQTVSGIGKAVWLIFLMFLPFATALVYLIVRGGGMSARSAERAQQAQSAAADYIRSVSSAGDPASEIATAKSLLDSGTITAAEFDKLKAAALRKA